MVATTAAYRPGWTRRSRDRRARPVTSRTAGPGAAAPRGSSRSRTRASRRPRCRLRSNRATGAPLRCVARCRRGVRPGARPGRAGWPRRAPTECRTGSMPYGCGPTRTGRGAPPVTWSTNQARASSWTPPSWRRARRRRGAVAGGCRARLRTSRRASSANASPPGRTREGPAGGRSCRAARAPRQARGTVVARDTLPTRPGRCDRRRRRGGGLPGGHAVVFVGVPWRTNERPVDAAWTSSSRASSSAASAGSSGWRRRRRPGARRSGREPGSRRCPPGGR